jgi:ABC-type sugar transport system substrate-binding protein
MREHSEVIGIGASPLLGRLLACLLVAFLAAGCDAAGARERLDIVFINPGKTGEVFWDMVSLAMRAAAVRLDIDLEILCAERNRKTLEALGLEAINRAHRPDFLILVNEESAATPVVEAADRAGVKTFLLSNAFIGEEANKYGPPRTLLVNWIGSLEPDMKAAGARMAHYLVDAAAKNRLYSDDGKIHLLALGGDDRTPNSIARTEGFFSALAASPEVTVDRLLYANWNNADARTLTARYLDWAEHAGLRPAGVWAANDPMALGALDAIEAKGLQAGKDIGVVGLNWSADALARIKSGKMIMTDGGHFLGGAWSLVMLRDYADGCDFAPQGAARMFPLAAIDRDNLDQVEGLVVRREFERVDFSRFLAKRSACGVYDFSLAAVLKAVDAAPVQ